MKITMVSSHESTTSAFAACMRKLGHAADYYMPTSALTEAMLCHPDLVVVMGDGDFRPADFIKRLRIAGHTNLVLALVEDNSRDTLIKTMQAGADQVCDISANGDELAARVLALLRYCRPYAADRLIYNSISIEPEKLTAHRENTLIPVKGKPFSLLEFFVRNPEKVHSRERIGESVWDRNLDVFSNVIDVTVSKLRKHLDSGFARPYLHTVVGSGYILSEVPPGSDSMSI